MGELCIPVLPAHVEEGLNTDIRNHTPLDISHCQDNMHILVFPSSLPTLKPSLIENGSASMEFPSLGNLDHEIQENQKALDMTTEDDPSYPERLTRLGVSLTLRLDRVYDPECVQAAVNTLQKARGLLAERHPLTVEILGSLCACYGWRFQRQGELQDLEDSIEKFQAVANILTEADPGLPNYLRRLSQSAMLRYGRLGELEDLEFAINTSQKALGLVPKDSPVLPIVSFLIANALLLRYSRLGDLEDLHGGVEKFQTAINVISDNWEKPMECGTSDSENDMRDIDSSMQYFREALQLAPEGHPGVPAIFNSLAGSFALRYSRSDSLDDLSSGMEAANTSLKLMPPDYPHIARGHHCVAELCIMKYQRFGNLDDLKTALHNAEAAVQKMPQGDPFQIHCLHTLAEAFEIQYTISGSQDDLNAAFSHYSASFQLPSDNVSFSWTAASKWASLAREHSSIELLKAYKSMFALLPETLWIGNSLSARQQEVTRFDLAQTTSDAVAACVKHENLALAIELLDQGLATSFQHMLQLRPDLGRLPEADATKLHEISLQLYAGASPQAQQLAIDRNKLLAEIRQRPDFENFLLPKSYSVLRKASQNGPLIILNAHKNRCDCIILLNPASDPLHVQLPDVTAAGLEHQKEILKGLLSRCNVRSRDSDSTRLFAGREGSRSKSVHESFEEMLAWLWKNVVGLIYQALENNNLFDGRVWWCPTGAFTGLPLHAAAQSDQFISSYTATISALLEAQSSPESEFPKLGLVGVTHSGGRWQAALPGVKKEIDVVSALAGSHISKSLVGDQATVDAVTKQLQNCEWVHLACHGKQDLLDPPKSCLQLYGGTLELETIMRMPLSKAEFVFLAACQTAMGDAQLVNESFHLGGGFIAAGFRGSIGTLWSMRDSDGPAVAETVYKYLFRENATPKVTDAAKALQLAVRKMRDEGVPYERWVPFIHMGI
ncbi:CHAT domain-containing protein [Mycena vulgaris]|nr:CHAT domain-containing protein [Mycena vulgaris]